MYLSKRKRALRRKRKNSNFLFQLIAFVLLSASACAQINLSDAFPQLEFTGPVDIQYAPDGSDRLFVVEQEGIIRVFRNSSSVSNSSVFLDLRDRVVSGGELGLLGLTFHPDYSSNGYFYVNYTTGDSVIKSIIARFKVSSNPDSADKKSELKIIVINQPEDNHNGGQIRFGPDGFLYSSFGDGGGIGDPDNNGQKLTTLLGKIIRINVDSTDGTKNYCIPDGNPFKGNTSGYNEEIYAYGFRNPWRFSFDELTGKLWCADVGQSSWEEIDTVTPGGNYGWRLKEGNHCYDPSENCDTVAGLIPPVFEYAHPDSDRASITGGFVYRGIAIPSLSGKYVYSDFISGKIWALTFDSLSSPENEEILEAPGNITSFGIDQYNEIYACVITSQGNKIYKISSATGIDDINGTVSGYKMSEAFPNPFNPATSFSFTIPENNFVKIEILSVTGEVIKTIKNEVLSKGTYQVKWQPENAASGIYFIRLNAVTPDSKRSYQNTIKAIYLK